MAPKKHEQNDGAKSAPNAEDTGGDRPIDYLPEWSTYPDNLIHWRLINYRTNATKQDYEEIIRWICDEEKRYNAISNVAVRSRQVICHF